MDLIQSLPKVRGEYRALANLSNNSWFRVGGKADVLFKPIDIEDLSTFLRYKPKNIPCEVLGACSNVIIRDLGIEGVVIKLGRGFTNIEINDDIAKIGCGALDYNVAQYLLEHSLSGLEFLIGIPGAIGGAVAMNAGCYGSEISTYLVLAEAINRNTGEMVVLTREQMGFAYRYNNCAKDYIFVSATFQLKKGDRGVIREQMEKISQVRSDSQPIRSRTGGSTFKNPANGPDKAWQLIEKAGLRGVKVGGAQVSEKHCNFLLNLGDATAHDLEELAAMIQDKVYKNSGIMLEWEIKVIGRK